MKIDIIVPHYKEPWELCKYLFDSIAMQELVDWQDIRVIVVNDGDYCVLDASAWREYPYTVDYIIKEHGGVSAARNAGLMESKADYVIFCDSDDGFLNNLALFLLNKEMEDGEPPMINPSFIEECMGRKIGVDEFICFHRADATYIHGKAYNRKWLLERDIWFPDGVNLHEDVYFNSLVIAAAKDQIREVSTPLYLWRWNDGSVVRHQNDFLIRNYPSLVEVWKLVCNYMKDYGFEKEYKAMVVKFLLSAYYTFQLGSAMSPRNEKYRKEAEKAVAGWYKGVRKDFFSCGEKMISDYVKILRADAEQNGLLFERIDLQSWLNHIDTVKF